MKMLTNFSFKRVLLVFGLTTLATFASAQLSGNKTVGIDYLTIDAFVTDVNAQGVLVGGGGVVLLVPPGYTETAPIGGYNITATGFVAENISIIGVTGGPQPVITANAALVVGSLTDAIFKIVGGDYINIVNLNMQENAANTVTAAATNTMTEFGVALFYATATDGAQYNTIAGNTITLNRTYTNTFGVYSNVRHTATAPTVAADISAFSGSNSYNKIYTNIISNVNFAIVFNGSSVIANMDMGNDIGGASLSTGNIITNYATAAAASAYVNLTGSNYGIFVNHQLNNAISFNSITSSVHTGTNTLGGILQNYSATSPNVVTTSSFNNNTVTLSKNASSGALIGINSQGITAATAGSSLTMNNNQVINCAVLGTNSSSALTGITNLSAFASLTINGNTIAGNTSTATTGGFTGISNTAAVIGSISISNNQIGTSMSNAITFSAATSGAVNGISNTGAANTSSVTVSSNNIQGIVNSVNGTNAQNYFTTTGLPLNLLVTNNTITNITAATAGTITLFVSGYTIPTSGTQTFTNNSIVTGFSKTVAGGSLIVFTTNSGSPAGTSHTATGNNFSGISVIGATILTGWSNTDGGAPTKTITGNTFSNWTGGTSAITVINQNFGGNNCNVSSNTITNINSSGAIVGIVIGASNTGTLQTVSNNTITGLSSTGGNVNGISCGASTVTTMNINNNAVNTLSSGLATGQVVGILSSAGTAATVNIFNHSIFGLSASGVTPLIAGIATIGTLGTLNVYSNKVYGLNASGAVTNTAISAIALQGGITNNVYNNVISGLASPLANSINAITGIQVNSTVVNSNYRVYDNSVYVNGTSSGTNFGTSGILHTANATATTGSLDLRNNIIINESVANGTGLTVAYRRTSTAVNNYAATSNRNLLYAGAPSATNVILNDGTASQQTFANYQTYVGTRDANSFTGEATYTASGYGTAGNFFISTAGSNVDCLRPVGGITTQVESGGSQITTPAITTDYINVIRALETGYAGTGTNPDIGAYEFNGVSPAPSITLNSVTPPATSQCTTSSRLVSVNVTTVSGTITGATLNYSFNGTPQTAVVMTNTAGTTWEGTMTASLPVNATVTWNVVATNSGGLTSTYVGSTYSDEPLFGSTASASASNTTVCAGNPTTLTASLSKPGTVTLGTAITATTSTEELTAFCNRRVSYKMQTVYTAAELNALGLIAGPITSIGYTINSIGDAANNNLYTVNIGTTALSTLTDFVVSTGFTTVFTPTNYVHAVGLNTITFTTPYVWDGTSNIIIEVTHNGMNAINNAQTVYTTTAGNTVAFGFNGATVGTLSNRRFNIVFAGNVTPAITSVTWMDGAATVGTGNPLTANPTTTTTYIGQITSSGCVFSPAPTVMVTVNPLPTAVTGTNSSQCGTQVPTASVASTTGAPTPTFNWYDAPTAGTLLQSSTSTTYTTAISVTTTFYVSEVNGVTGCESMRTAVTVSVVTPDAVSASASASPICIGSSVTLTSANTNPTPFQTYSYSWMSTSGSGAEVSTPGNPLTVTPTAPGTYVYTVTAVDGGCTTTNTVSVTVDPLLASVTPINATCNGFADGSFSLTSSSCGTMPYTYSVNGGAFGAIPTNLAAGTYNIVVRDNNSYVTGGQSITINQPTTTITNPVGTNATVCQNDLSALVNATASTSVPTAGSLVVPFNVTSLPTPEANAAPGNVVTSATYTLPAGATVTGGTLVYNNILPLGASWQSDVRLGFSGAVVNAAAMSPGSLNTPSVFNYSRPIPAGAISASGTVNLLYWDDFNDIAGGPDATFPFGAGVATLTINYTTPTPATISWWNASTAGTQIGTGSPFETVGTSVLPTTATPGVYTVFAQGQNGACPSPGRTAVTVTVNANSASTIANTSCDSYTLNGTTYTTSGTYLQTIANAAGCDSTITLNLTINNSTSSTITDVACNSYTLNSTTYTSTGTYVQTMTNAAGCDSTITLNLTINNSTNSTYSDVACGSYDFNGTILTSSGTYFDTLTNASGCDSTITLNLTINNATSSIITIAECGSYDFNGTILTSSGTYFDTLSNASGCDSTITLNLTINNATSSTINATACGFYVLNGTTYTVTGTHLQTTTNAAGCDSTITLNLVINTVPVAVATDNGDGTLTSSTGTTYQWINCGTGGTVATTQTFTAIANGNYAVIVTNASGCSDTSTCVLIDYIGIDEIKDASITVFPNPTHDNVTITMTSEKATVRIVDAQGKLLEILEVTSGSTVSLARFETGMYFLNIQTENGSALERIVKN